MRHFSEREKEYICKLYERTRNLRDSYLAINLLYDYLYKNGVSYTVGSNNLVFDRKVDNVDSSEMIAIENTVLELTMLLDYLEKNGLIMYVKDHPEEKGAVMGKVIKNGISKPTAPIVTEQLTKASSYRIVVGETLRDLVINNFKTYEDQTLELARHQSELALTSLNEAKEQTRNAIEATEQAQKQTRLAQESLIESRLQTQKATEALKEAQKQTKKANVNTFIASLALFVSIITFCLSQCSTQHVIVDECHQSDKACSMGEQSTKENDTTELATKAKEPSVIQSSDKKKCAKELATPSAQQLATPHSQRENRP